MALAMHREQDGLKTRSPNSKRLAFGAIVGPPDAAAAVATLINYCLPRRTDAVLKGESLFNDATALLLFNGLLLVLEGAFH